MKHFPWIVAVALVALVSTPALAQDVEKKLIGTWKADLEIDEEKLSELLGEGKEAEERLKQYQSELQGITIRLVLKEDGKSEMTTSGLPGDPTEVSSNGTWKYTGTEEREIDGENKNVIKLAGETDEGDKEELELIMVDDNSFQMMSENIESSFFKAPIFKRQE